MKKVESILWGVVLIAIGLIIAGNVLGIISINIFFDGWWTLFIIVPCFIGLFKNSGKTGKIIGIIIGTALLLACQDILRFELIWELMFPTILIVIGLSFIFRDTLGGKINEEIKRLNKNRASTNEYCATFSEQNVKFDDEKFIGADLTAVFGGVKCDLRKAKIEEDQIINATSIFGGVDIFVPENVKVKIKSTPIFGGVSDKTNNTKDEQAHIIYINATCIFGGVEVK